MEFLMGYFYLALPKFEAVGVFGYWIVGLVSYLEAVVFVGSIIPGATFIVLAGLFASLGYLDIKDLVWFAAIGTILGDFTSYYLGTKGTHYFKNENTLLKFEHLEKGKIFFRKYGALSLILGKVVAPVKAVVPFVAGLSHMKRPQFHAWNIISGFVWALLYLFIGYFFGSSWETIEMWLSRAGIFSLALLCAVFFIRVLANRRAEIALLFSASFSALESRSPKFSRFLRNRFNTSTWKGTALSFLSFFLIFLLLAYAGVVNEILQSDPIAFADKSLEKILRFFRDPRYTVFFVWVTFLVEKKAAFALTLAAVALLYAYNKRTYIIPLLAALFGQSIFVYVTKQIVERVRPDGFDPLFAGHSFSFPSAHAAFAFVFFGFLAYAAIRNLSSWQTKTNAIFAGILIIFFIGLSRLYLGVHYLSDVLGGYLAGAIWLIVGIALAEWSLHKKQG